ncbi:MAG TPA: YihY/virulence factor BrkB family protein [Methanothrix sp.]|nr:YihY/virulence factor BrkB family protein [Methanothrix sp.]
MRLKAFLRTLQEAFSEWQKDDASLLAAALAYYGIFSLVPLLILLLILINSLIGHEILAADVAGLAQELAGQRAPGSDELIYRAREQAASFRFTLLSIIILLLAAAGLFVQTKRAFHIIWAIREDKPFVTGAVRSYVKSFLLIVFVAFMLLLSSFVTAVLLPIGKQIEEQLPVHLGLLRGITFLISFLFITLLFAMTYKTLSDVALGWMDVLTGSAVTALLLAAGNFVIEIYVSLIDLGSAYGAAGSLVVFLFWIYYSAQIFLFGAELIKVQKKKRDSEIEC